MTKRGRSLALLLFAMIGLALWAAYLFLVYGAQTLACLPLVAPAGETSLMIAMLVSAAFVLALLVLAAWQWTRRDRNEEVTAFTSAMSFELIVLAAIGVIWIALAAAFVPLCAPAS